MPETSYKDSIPIEYTTDRDIFYDYCLWEYKPIVPYENKFRSINLLFHSFNMTNASENFYALVKSIREGIGIFNTVWGIKQEGKDLSWEFYFYDYKRRDRDISISRLLEIIRPLAPSRLKVNENLHYFMFSIDFSNDLLTGKQDLEEVHMYIGNPGSSVSSGICYSLTREQTRLENLYCFFDAEKQMDDIIPKVICSSHIDISVINLNEIIIPELKECRVIVVANKKQNDSIYFSGIDIDQFIFFLKKMGYDTKLISFAEENRSMLDHLKYDVGIDYRMEENRLRILKSGFYGFF